MIAIGHLEHSSGDLIKTSPTYRTFVVEAIDRYGSDRRASTEGPTYQFLRGVASV